MCYLNSLGSIVKTERTQGYIWNITNYEFDDNTADLQSTCQY